MRKHSYLIIQALQFMQNYYKPILIFVNIITYTNVLQFENVVYAGLEMCSKTLL